MNKVEFLPSKKAPVHGQREVPHAGQLRPVAALLEPFHVTVILKSAAPNTTTSYALAEFAAAHNLSFLVSPGDLIPHLPGNTGERTIKLHGSAADMEAAFEVELIPMVDYAGNIYRTREGTIKVPEDIHSELVAVLGLDNRPQAASYHVVRPKQSIWGSASAPKGATPDASTPAPTSFNPPQVAALYSFPAGNGAGQVGAVIELGGGYTPSQNVAYFQSVLGTNGPTITDVLIDGATNSPSTADSADGEVQLDLQVMGSIASGASIECYFAPNTDQGFVDAITAVGTSRNKPSVCSISWGGPEDSWTEQARTAMDMAIEELVAMGITVLVAAGDSGSTDGETGNHVDFPGSGVYSTSCGGTTLIASNNTIASEVVWNELSNNEGAGGGGRSAYYLTPKYQSHVNNLKYRGVPDVTGNADPVTGYNVSIDGSNQDIGGTSAVAPLLGALVLIVNANTGKRTGFLNEIIYNHQVCRDITQGNNGAFSATRGWDAASGQGVIIGTELEAAVAKYR